MARVEFGHLGGRGNGCSYKRIALVVCCLNILIALFVLRSLYASLYVYSDNVSEMNYSLDQIRKMEESIRIRRENKPMELIKLVKSLEKELSIEEQRLELPAVLKHRLSDEILERLRGLDQDANITMQRETLETWRKEKLENVKKSIVENEEINSTASQEEKGMLVRALESDWDLLSEEIGLWLPAEVNNLEHDDKLEDEEEPEDVLPGRPLRPECRAELHTDYGGQALRWGLTHHKESAADCCQACLDQAKNAKPGALKCNIWVYCPSEFGCHSPDIYQHKHQECWLKYAEHPKATFRNRYSESYRNSHPKAPVLVPWVSGVVKI